MLNLKDEFTSRVKKILIIYSPPCDTRSCLSFFSRKEIKVSEENIPGFSPYRGLQRGPMG